MILRSNLLVWRRRIENGASSSSGHRASAPESVPMAMAIDVPSVVDPVADMDIVALLEKQVGELGMLMTALGQTETHVAEIFGPGQFTVRARRFDLRPALPWVSVLGLTSTGKLTV